MNITMDYLRSNRKWLVRDYTVWGDNGNYQADMVLTEENAPNDRVIFHHQYSGGIPQIVNFADLTDHRGNQIPTMIKNAHIILIAKSPIQSFILGPVGSTSFHIAKPSTQSGDSIVDILIMEMN